MDIFKGEYKVRAIGGRMENDYYQLRTAIFRINENIIPLLLLLGINKPEDTDLALDIILSNFIDSSAKKAFTERIYKDVENGRIKIESLLSRKTIEKKADTPEQKEKRINTALKKVINMRYKDKVKDYYEKYNPSSICFPKCPILICRKAIILTPSGLSIDIPKFIEIYTNYLEANQSKTKKQHQAAADAMNTFFNGLAIDHNELSRYFLLEGGEVKPNPESINKESYLRLGYRGKTKVIKG